MEVRPIFIAAIPVSFNDDIESMENLIRVNCSDYNVLVYTNEEIAQPEFKAFYPKDFKQIEFDRLKEMVLSRTSEVAVV